MYFNFSVLLTHGMHLRSLCSRRTTSNCDDDDDDDDGKYVKKRMITFWISRPERRSSSKCNRLLVLVTRLIASRDLVTLTFDLGGHGACR